ncbi:MAG: HAMP domain-containing sensor histidine kinase [bacterium]|nr:HAMP domain-containing sensor histidine kinase [bacterium]
MGLLIALVSILSILCLILFIMNIAHLQNSRYLMKQVECLMKEDTNAELKLAAPEKKMQQVFLSINRLLRVTRNRQIYYINKERDLRKQMSNISHDLRTPLTSILGYIGLAKDEEISKEERKEYLEIVEKRAKILQDLITGVYDLSRMEEDKYMLNKESLQLNKVLYEVLALYYNEFEIRDYECTIEIEEDVPEILADRKAMVRIYSNILQNVLRHGIHKLNVSLIVKEDKIETIISNDTDEIAKEDLPKIFDRFYMADRMRTGQNTGLGLAIVKKLSELMEGQVEALYENTMFGIKITWPLRKSVQRTGTKEE